MTDNKEAKIRQAYIDSNIYIWGWDNDDLMYRIWWLAGMGMLETLIIMGISAEADRFYGR